MDLNMIEIHLDDKRMRKLKSAADVQGITIEQAAVRAISTAIRDGAQMPRFNADVIRFSKDKKC